MVMLAVARRVNGGWERQWLPKHVLAFSQLKPAREGLHGHRPRLPDAPKALYRQDLAEDAERAAFLACSSYAELEQALAQPGIGAAGVSAALERLPSLVATGRGDGPAQAEPLLQRLLVLLLPNGEEEQSGEEQSEQCLTLGVPDLVTCLVALAKLQATGALLSLVLLQLQRCAQSGRLAAEAEQAGNAAMLRTAWALTALQPLLRQARDREAWSHVLRAAALGLQPLTARVQLQAAARMGVDIDELLERQQQLQLLVPDMSLEHISSEQLHALLADLPALTARLLTLCNLLLPASINVSQLVSRHPELLIDDQLSELLSCTPGSVSDPAAAELIMCSLRQRVSQLYDQMIANMQQRLFMTAQDEERLRYTARALTQLHDLTLVVQARRTAAAAATVEPGAPAAS